MRPTPRKIVAATLRARHHAQAARLAADVVAQTPRAIAFRDLHPMSLALAGISPRGSQRAVNVVLPRLTPGAVFAGIKTAIDVGFALAEQSSLPLRFIAFGIEALPSQRRKIAALLAERGRPGGHDVSVIPINDVTATLFHPNDVWVATHWATAHALDIAARLGRVTPTQVVYLIQDFEPGFNPWSSDYSIAEATYRAGFVSLVNSVPLARYLRTHGGIDVPRDRTFAPQLDLEQLARAARIRASEQKSLRGAQNPGRTNILFYGRPQTPKNMFPLGVAALRASVAQLTSRGSALTVTSIGEKHAAVSLGAGHVMPSVGRVTWQNYFDHVARSGSPLSESLRSANNIRDAARAAFLAVLTREPSQEEIDACQETLGETRNAKALARMLLSTAEFMFQK